MRPPVGRPEIQGFVGALHGAQANRGRFESLDTAATARGMAGIEEDGELDMELAQASPGIPGPLAGH